MWKTNFTHWMTSSGVVSQVNVKELQNLKRQMNESYTLTLSANDPQELASRAEEVSRALQSGLALEQLSQDLCARTSGSCRLALVVPDTASALKRLSRRLRPVQAVPGRPLGFLFTGLGDQFQGMASSLDFVPGFKARMEHLSQIAQPHLGEDLKSALQGEEPTTMATHAGLFAVQFCLAQTLMDWGLKPAFTAGYSLGEYLSACLGGVFTLEDGLEIVIKRAGWMESLPTGSMSIVPLSEEKLQPYLTEGVEVIIRNGPEVCVVGGASDVVENLGRALCTDQISSLPVKNRYPVHSDWMEPIREQLVELIGQKSARPTRIPFPSNLTGTWITDDQATDPHYWGRHLTQSADFSGVLETVWNESSPALVELGPGGTLSLLARQHPASPRIAVTANLLAAKGADQPTALRQGMARLWEAGISPNVIDF
jgi:phthiocerol/phenolphthiocerol synthesis type-I polyketide synthase E